MGNYGKGILLLIIVLLFITFGLENNQPVQLKYYFKGLTTDFPLYGVVYISIIVGIIIGMIIGLRSRLHMRKTVKNLQKENSELKGMVPEKGLEKREEAVDV